jgi:hypothetical protein
MNDDARGNVWVLRGGRFRHRPDIPGGAFTPSWQKDGHDDAGFRLATTRERGVPRKCARRLTVFRQTPSTPTARASGLT